MTVVELGLTVADVGRKTTDPSGTVPVVGDPETLLPGLDHRSRRRVEVVVDGHLAGRVVAQGDQACFELGDVGAVGRGCRERSPSREGSVEGDDRCTVDRVENVTRVDRGVHGDDRGDRLGDAGARGRGSCAALLEAERAAPVRAPPTRGATTCTGVGRCGAGVASASWWSWCTVRAAGVVVEVGGAEGATGWSLSVVATGVVSGVVTGVVSVSGSAPVELLAARTAPWQPWCPCNQPRAVPPGRRAAPTTVPRRWSKPPPVVLVRMSTERSWTLDAVLPVELVWPSMRWSTVNVDDS